MLVPSIHKHRITLRIFPVALGIVKHIQQLSTDLLRGAGIGKFSAVLQVIRATPRIFAPGNAGFNAGARIPSHRSAGHQRHSCAGRQYFVVIFQAFLAEFSIRRAYLNGTCTVKACGIKIIISAQYCSSGIAVPHTDDIQGLRNPRLRRHLSQLLHKGLIFLVCFIHINYGHSVHIQPIVLLHGGKQLFKGSGRTVE